MSLALITGSAGLIGSEAARFFAAKGLDVVGIDNDMRRSFFGEGASNSRNLARLQRDVPTYRHSPIDIRDLSALEPLFSDLGEDIAIVIHAAAQPSHDWAARAPFVDFGVNATGTMNMLEMTRLHAPGAVFIFTSTNKVYGDTPNALPLVEQAERWEVDPAHPFAEHGIDETMPIDRSLHSLFGASKLAADVLVQEYGRYFGLKTTSFRGGCLTGPAHSGTELHGFLAYLMLCVVHGGEYTVFGHKAKQVRDNIHSFDLVNAFWHVFQAPRAGEVYNIGGGRHSNCSMLEAIRMCQELTGRHLNWNYADRARSGDHIWWISDMRRFRSHYPSWEHRYGIEEILIEIRDALRARESG